MSSKKNLNTLETLSKKKVKPLKPVLKFYKKANSPSILSPTKILREIKSQSAFNYTGQVAKKNTQAVKKVQLASTLKNQQLFKGTEHPSPINSHRKKNFYSITDEEFDDINLFLEQLNK